MNKIIYYILDNEIKIKFIFFKNKIDITKQIIIA